MRRTRRPIPGWGDHIEYLAEQPAWVAGGDGKSEVVEFDFDLTATFRNLDARVVKQAAFIAENRPKVSEAASVKQIAAAHKAKPVDLFFSYFYDPCVCRKRWRRFGRWGSRR